MPDGASPVDPGPSLLDIYAAMVIGHRAQDRDLSDEQALERCKPDVRTTITYVLGRIEATGTSSDEETKHRLTMTQLKGMPIGLLDRKYNLYRMENQGINLDNHPEYRPTDLLRNRHRPTDPRRNSGHHHRKAGPAQQG